MQPEGLLSPDHYILLNTVSKPTRAWEGLIRSSRNELDFLVQTADPAPRNGVLIPYTIAISYSAKVTDPLPIRRITLAPITKRKLLSLCVLQRLQIYFRIFAKIES